MSTFRTYCLPFRTKEVVGEDVRALASVDDSRTWGGFLYLIFNDLAVFYLQDFHIEHDCYRSYFIFTPLN